MTIVRSWSSADLSLSTTTIVGRGTRAIDIWVILVICVVKVTLGKWTMKPKIFTIALKHINPSICGPKALKQYFKFEHLKAIQKNFATPLTHPNNWRITEDPLIHYFVQFRWPLSSPSPSARVSKLLPQPLLSFQRSVFQHLVAWQSVEVSM